MSPDDVASDGHMDFVVRRAIELGLSPMQAIQAATLNPATYSGLEQELGGIAPGRYADIAFLEDLNTVRVHSTMIGGEVLAKEGKSLVSPRPVTWPEETVRCLRLSPIILPASFRIPCPLPRARIRVMELLSQNITAETIMDVAPRDGALQADSSRDLLKVAVFERHRPSGGVALGFLKGLGASVGAVGTTTNLDENTLLIAGSNDEEMALCANLLIEAGGGMAVVDRGEGIEKIDFPVGGVFSLRPWQEGGKGLGLIHRCLRERGSLFSKPIYALMFLTFVTLPSLRITARGLVNAKERKLVSLFAEE